MSSVPGFRAIVCGVLLCASVADAGQPTASGNAAEGAPRNETAADDTQPPDPREAQRLAKLDEAARQLLPLVVTLDPNAVPSEVLTDRARPFYLLSAALGDTLTATGELAAPAASTARRSQRDIEAHAIARARSIIAMQRVAAQLAQRLTVGPPGAVLVLANAHTARLRLAFSGRARLSTGETLLESCRRKLARPACELLPGERVGFTLDELLGVGTFRIGVNYDGRREYHELSLTMSYRPFRSAVREGSEARVSLDRTGIASLGFLNPRDPRYLFGGVPVRNEPGVRQEGEGIRLETLEELRTRWLTVVLPAHPVRLTFDTSETGLTFIVRIPGLSAAARPKLLREGLVLEKCDTTCEGRLDVRRGASQSISGEGLYEALTDKKGFATVTSFTVSIFEDARELTNATGYVTLVERSRLAESKSATSWSVSATLTAVREPDVSTLIPAGADAAIITTDKPLPGGEYTRRVSGATRLRVRQTLNTRADADIVLRAQEGDFGGPSGNRSVSVTQARVNTNATSGLRLSFGRFDVAKPSEGVAISESGDAVAISMFDRLALSYLVKRESADDKTNKANEANRDHSAFVFQARDFIPRMRLNVTGVYGDEDKPTDKHRYVTVGGEAAFDFARDTHTFQTSAALYGSRRWPGRCGTVCEASTTLAASKGVVGLFKLSWAPKPANVSLLDDDAGVPFVIGGTFGFGRGDRPGTPHDEGYLGETASYPPDTVPLAKYVGLIRTGEVPLVEEKNADGTVKRNADGSVSMVKHYPGTGFNTNGQVGSGLANKVYLSTGVTFKRFSLLRLPAYAFRAQDLGAATTSVRVHGFRFVEPVFGEKDGGAGIDFESTLEAPKGIRNTLTAAYFAPGRALRRLLPERIWYLAFTLTLELK